MTSWPSATARSLDFGARFRLGLRKPGVFVAAAAGLGLGLHGREAIDSRGLFLTVSSGLAMALLWATVWLVVRALLVRFVDLGHPTVKRGYLGGMVLAGLICIVSIAGDDTDYFRDYRYVVVTLVVAIAVMLGGIPGLLVGHVLVRGHAALSRRAPTTHEAAKERRPDTPGQRMLKIGEPYPHGPVDDTAPADGTASWKKAD